jgi:branched-chain amino acid transport system substrate-binding protein
MDVRRSTAFGAAALALCLGAAACGSGSSSDGKAPTSKVTFTGDPIKIGTIGSYSGSQASSQAGAEKVLKAFVQSTNDAGGINGHRLDLVVKDIGDNVAGGLAAAKDLVEQEKVVAIVGESDNADTTWASYIAGTGVPVIGGLSINLPFVTNPDFFPAGTNVLALVYGMLVEAKKLGDKFGFLYCAESPQCASAVPLVQGIGQVLGLKVPVAIKVSGSAPDYTAVCQQLKDSGVQSYQVANGSAVVVRIATACAKAGVKAKTLNTDGAATMSWTREPALDGTLLSEAVFPFTSSGGAGPAAYQALLAKYLPDLGDLNGPNAAYSYVAGVLFSHAAKAAGDSVTPASLKKALYTIKNETLGGLTPPLTFVEGKPTAVNCYFVMGLNGGKYSGIGPGATTCAPDPLVSGILQQLAKSAG